VARGIALAAIVLAAGAVGFRRLLLRRWPSGNPPPGWARQAAAAGIAAGVMLAAVSPLRLYCQARALVDPPDPAMPMMGNVLLTRWGHTLVVQVVVACIAIGGFAAARRGRDRGWIAAFVAVLVLTLTPAFMGHAIASERYMVVAVAGDWLHVLAASAWIGTLTLMLQACAAARTTSEGGSDIAILVDLFHPVAVSAATIIFLTGIVSAWLRLDRLRDLYTSEYGALLLAKLALVAVVLGLGAYHSRSAARIARTRGAGGVFRSLALEVAFAVLVLAVTAMLVGTSPPMAG
jgi:copper transport protein